MSSDTINQRFLYIPKRALVISLILHCLFPVSFGVIKILQYFGLDLLSSQAPKMSIYQELIQVDIVGLPDSLQKEIDKIDVTLPESEKPTTSKNAKTPDNIVKENIQKEEMTAWKLEKQKQEDRKQAMEQLAKQKELEKEKALQKLKEEASREAALKEIAKKKAEAETRAKLKGNILSKGISTSGAIGDARSRYEALLLQRIKQHFNVFPWQKKKNLKAVVFIQIYTTGKLKERKFLEKSADSLYDSAVIQAIEDASPLPVPEDLSFIKDGITITFKPEMD